MHIYLWDASKFTEEELQALCRGEVVQIGAARYRVCGGCRTVIRVNKPIFGSIHLCDETEGRRKR